MQKEQQDKTPFTSKGSFVFVLVVLFVLVYAGMFLSGKDAAVKDFASANARMQDIFSRFGVFGGVVFGLVAWLAIGILRGLASVVGLTKLSKTTAIICILVFGALLAFGIQLVYIEPRFTSIAKAIIFFMGKPLFYASAVAVVISLVAAVFSKGRRSDA